MTFPTTLILTRYMEPLRVISWQDAITELFTGKVEIVAEYDEVIYRNADRGVVMRMPAVARLLKVMPRFKKRPPRSRARGVEAVLAYGDPVGLRMDDRRPEGQVVV